MTLVDTNILIYATSADVREHDRCRAWLEQQLAEPDGLVSLCWPVIYSFTRLITNPRVFGSNSVSVEDGWEIVTALLNQSAVRIVTAGERHKAIASQLAATPGLRSDDVSDVEVAALAIEHGLVLATHDSGFRRFPGVRCFDPLA